MPVRYWLFVSLTLSLTAFIGYGTYATAKLLRSWRPDRNLLLLPAENGLRIALIFVCGGLGLLSGLSFSELGWTFDDAPSQLLWGVIWGLLLATVFYTATRWLMQKTGERFYSSVMIESIVPTSRGEFLLVLLAMIPVVLLEELLFRSLLLGGLIPVLPAHLLVIGIGLLFGLMHSPQGAWGVAGAALAGMFFGLLFLQTGSLLMPLVAHYTANIVQIGRAMQTEIVDGTEKEATEDNLGV